MNDLTAVARLRTRISKRAADPRLLLVPGLADDLRLIGEAFGTIEQHLSSLSRVVLAREYGYAMEPADYHVLSALGRVAEPVSG
jgi:hypothetical protein